MWAFLISHIAEVLFTAAVGVLSAMYAKLSKRLKRQEALNDGVVAILHSEIFKQARGIIDRGEITLGELDNLTKLFEAYHEAGGNGTGTKLYNDCKDLPLKKGE